MEIYNKSKNPKCQLCSQEATPQEKWKMPFTEIDTCRLNAKDIKSASEISATEWICDKCYNAFISTSTVQPSSHLEYITDQVEKFINHVKSKGYALRKTAIESFKSHLLVGENGENMR